MLISNLIAKLQSDMDKLLMQVLDVPTRADAQLDLLFTNQEDLPGDVMLNGSFACSEQKQRWLKSKVKKRSSRAQDPGVFKR